MLLVNWYQYDFLAGIIYLPYRFILIAGLAILFFHNTLSTVTFPEGSSMATFWAFFYSGGIAAIGNIRIYFLYPILPFIGLSALGYLFTPQFYFPEKKNDINWSRNIGHCCVHSSAWVHIYGDPSLGNRQKYNLHDHGFFAHHQISVSLLLYCLMTLGPALIALALVEPLKNRIARFFITIGEVPCFITSFP